MSRPGLGRLHAPDERDLRYPMRRVVRRIPERTVMRRPPRRILNQGSTSTCVGHGWRGWLEAGPIMVPANQGPDAFDIYRAAILVDEWPENNQDTALSFGTSVRAAANVMQEQGRLVNYVWGFGASDVIGFLIEHGPVVMGTNWYAGMDAPGPDGLVKVDGEVLGGHAWLVFGYNARRRLFRAQNSWGPGWGDDGRFWISRDDLDRLIREEGEACGGTERAVKPAA